MAHCLTRTVFDNLSTLKNSFLRLSIADPIVIPNRGRKQLNPRHRFIQNPIWFVRKERKPSNQYLTHENRSFVKEIVHDKYGEPVVIGGISTYSKSGGILKDSLELPKAEWTSNTMRCGAIARKIGVYPLWFKDGSKIQTTLLQIVDNHVIKYIPPGEVFANRPPKVQMRHPERYGALIVGAESVDPTNLTKEYCGLFKNSGVMPKRVLSKFLITPNAFLNPGTPLTAAHFRVGDYVDVRGKTIDRGFQGVMKRWGFKGMPASHGVTKTHRRGGNIGGGGEKGRVWPGTKMPGLMGGRFRICRGVRIWRINTKYNVLWVSGLAIPGDTNSFCYIYDTMLPLRRPKIPPPFPTAFPNAEDTDLPEDLYCEELHQFSDPTVTFDIEKE